jgi:hypothetical protein
MPTSQIRQANRKERCVRIPRLRTLISRSRSPKSHEASIRLHSSDHRRREQRHPARHPIWLAAQIELALVVLLSGLSDAERRAYLPRRQQARHRRLGPRCSRTGAERAGASARGCRALMFTSWDRRADGEADEFPAISSERSVAKVICGSLVGIRSANSISTDLGECA